MTLDEALDILWENKDWQNRTRAETFLYATTTEPGTLHEWDGAHPVEENTVERHVPAGTRVLVTMISRFGDVGIRARNLVPACHGYDARVSPKKLTDWSRTP